MVLALFLALSLLLSAVPAWAVKAFPTAEGYGAADTVGGRGGEVILVTNLNDSGAGSLRACVEGTGPRTCIFRIGGMIELNSQLNILEGNSYLTIAGQTAPGEGVTVGPWPINISYGAHDVIIRHLRHRQAFESWGQAGPPPNENNDCGSFIIYGPAGFHTHHVILDHVSVGYTCDDSMQMSGYVTDSTIQWSLVADPYEAAKGDSYGATKGFIFGGNNPSTAPLSTGTVHHTMFLHTGTRNPGGGPQGVMDWRYNLVYNWFACTGSIRIGGTDDNIPGSLQSNHNFVGNRYIAGPDTQADFTGNGCWLGELRTEGNAHVYVQDNVTPFCGMDSCASNAWNLGWGNGTTQSYPAASGTFQVFTPFSAPTVTATARTSMESALSANAGTTKPVRDALDARVINEMQSRTGTVGRQSASFPSLSTNTNFPQDTDNDGMPNAWESSHGLNPNNPSDRNTIASNGYTNLENYLNELAGDDVSGITPPSANANTIYVAKTGSDNNSCIDAENQSTPKLTIRDAILNCMTVPGKTLLIKAGTYSEELDTTDTPIQGGNGPSYSNATTISAYQSDTVVVQLPVGGVQSLYLGGSESFVVIQNIIWDGANRVNSAGIGCNIGVHHIKFVGGEIKNFTGGFEAVALNACDNIEFNNTLIHHAGTYGIKINDTVDDFTCTGCQVYSNGNAGITASTNGAKTNITIAQSQIYSNGDAGIDLLNTTGTSVWSSIIRNNGGMGVRVRNVNAGAKLYNLTVYGNTGVGVQCDSGATGTEIKNVLSYLNTGGNLTNSCTASTATNMTDGTNPLFTSAPTDLTLADGSPGINQGTTLASVPRDYAGTARPVGANYDIGAYDRTQTTPPQPPAPNTTVFPCNLTATGMFF